MLDQLSCWINMIMLYHLWFSRAGGVPGPVVSVQAEAGWGGGGRGGDQGGIPAVRPGRGRIHHQGRDARSTHTDGLCQVETDAHIIYVYRPQYVKICQELRGGGVQVHGGDGSGQGRAEECLHVMNSQCYNNFVSSGRESKLCWVRAAVAGQLTALSILHSLNITNHRQHCSLVLSPICNHSLSLILNDFYTIIRM